MDGRETPAAAADRGTAGRRPVRPRRAASLILLRPGEDGTPLVLMGRRGRGARFMPGAYVFAGGAVSPHDRLPWAGEGGVPEGMAPEGMVPEPGHLGLARAALRELFEETGLVLGRASALAGPLAAPLAGTAALRPIEDAYRAAGLRPALDLLTYIGRAITPTRSPMRFHARFFVADGRNAAGRLADSIELEDLAWRPARPDAIAPMSDVTRFMLGRAVALWQGERSGAALYSYVRGRPRIGPG